MWKFKLYHQWQYEKAEQYLSDMETQGYRLEKVVCSFFMKFKKSQPKATQYYFFYSFVKDLQQKHFHILQEIKSRFGGNYVCGKRFFENNVYRICRADADLSEVRELRDNYLKRAFCLKILLATLFFLPCVLLWLFGQLTPMNFSSILLICIAGISAFVIIYYLVGLIALKRKTSKLTK